MKRTLQTLLLLTLLGACEPEKIGPQQVTPASTGSREGRQVYLINEGNFQRGNASVSAYTPERKETQARVFSSNNGGSPLGDVFQDMARVGPYYYLVLNFSGLIRIVDTASWQQVAAIENMGSPRYLAADSNYVVVSDLFSAQVSLLSRQSKKVEQVVPMPAATGQVVAFAGKFAISARKKLVLLQAATAQIDTVLTLPQAIAGMAVDKQQRLWILTAGSNSGRLLALNSSLKQVKDWLLNNGAPAYLALDSGHSKVYWAAGDYIWQQSMQQDSLQAEQWLALNNRNLYGLDVDPKTHELYLSDALDFDQNAAIYRYDSLGNLLDQFEGGPLTNGFLFE